MLKGKTNIYYILFFFFFFFFFFIFFFFLIIIHGFIFKRFVFINKTEEINFY